MTTATPPSPSTDRGGAGDAIAGPAEEPPRRARRVRPVRSRWWRVGYPIVLALLVVAIPALVFAGIRVILDSNDGQLVRRVTDPAAPGYEAVVELTPTQLVVGVDAEGSLDSLTLLALTSDGIGGVMTIPATTLVPLDRAPLSLAFIHDTLGLEALAESVGGLLDVAVTDTQVVASTEWASLVGPSAPLTVESPDPVVDANGAVVFPPGSIQLTADQVWPYLSGRGARESDLNRMVRIQAFWTAWLEKLGTTGVSAIPVPTETGLGRFLAALSDDQVQYLTLPVQQAGPSSTGAEQFSVDTEASLDAIASIIPFPEGPPGARPRLRVLDGTGQLDNGVSAAIVLAAAGAQVDVVGNARAFGTPTTQFVYYDPAMEADASRLRDALGVGEVVQSEQTNSATDLTVVLGDDYLAVVGSDPSTAVEPQTLEGQDG
jgi:hypothetical protein